MVANSLKLVNHGVTHITRHSKTCLDLIIVDIMDCVSSWGKTDIPIGGGHLLIQTTLQLNYISSSACTTQTRKLVGLADPNALILLDNID